MATKDFVTDFGAPTNGSSSCAAAVAAWRAWIVAHPGDTLTIPAHVYYMEFADLICSDIGAHIGRPFSDGKQIPSCTITGAAGTKIYSWYACGSFVQFVQNQPQGFINTCFVGATSITLKTIGDAANFSVGGWLCVCGICLQSNGAPPNFQRHEFHKITNISGAVISLDSPLRYSYTDTWPNSIDTPTLGGAACLYSMGPGNGAAGCWWDNSYTVSGIEFITSDASGDGVMNSSGVLTVSPSVIGFSFQPVRTLTCANIIFGGASPGVSFCQLLTATGCTMTAIAAEIDKCNETAIYDNCALDHFFIQSASPEHLIIRNGCTAPGGFNAGFAKNTTISNATIGTNFNTGSGFGRCETLTVTSSTLPAVTMATHGIVPALLACLTYLGGGLWKFGSNDFNRALNFEQAIVPGFQYAFAYMTGDADIFPDPQFSTLPIYFCVTDISNATGAFTFNYYMQTDMTYGVGALPTPTMNTNPYNGFQAIPFTSFTIDGVHQVAFEPSQVCPVLTDTAPPSTFTGYKFVAFNQ